MSSRIFFHVAIWPVLPYTTSHVFTYIGHINTYGGRTGLGEAHLDTQLQRI